MRNKLGWLLAMLAIFTFSFGQATATAGQVLTAKGASVTVKQAAVQQAAVPAAAVPAAVLNAPTSPTDETKVPHYFGPYPNWANSPQVLSNAVVAISKGVPTPVSMGNPLVERKYATDALAAPGALGAVFVALPGTKLPAGTLSDFQVWNQGISAGSTTTSADNIFHAYVLRPTTGTANGYTVVYDSGVLTMPTPSVLTGEIATFAVSPAVAVAANDVIGFYGEGIPLDTGITVNPDTISSPATADSTLATNVAPVKDATMTLGVTAGFPLYPTQDRTYS
ncbi:MAG: hypothetical protein IMZ75_02945, partial [Actinobacteria bacterium]|nr:hypothetical protein [Actinomycetota bacterium]